jgi:hypothetical protein
LALSTHWGLPLETVMLRVGQLSARLKAEIQARPEAFLRWAGLS